MKKLGRPKCSVADTYSACLKGIANQNFRERLHACCADIQSAETSYIEKGESTELFTIPASNGPDNTVVLGEVKQKELKKLYSNYMVPKKKPGRIFYDQILILANGKCPLCSIGHASTLDHYLPKSKFPIFSVTPLNLVPACRDCNHEKNDAAATRAEDQVLHPYFDDGKFYSEKWIYAKVDKTNPPSISFYPKPPTHWDTISKKRAEAHFSDFNLARKYGIEASDELTSLIDQLKKNMKGFNKNQIAQHLLSVADSISLINHWKTVMYTELANDDCFAVEVTRI